MPPTDPAAATLRALQRERDLTRRYTRLLETLHDALTEETSSPQLDALLAEERAQRAALDVAARAPRAATAPAELAGEVIAARQEAGAALARVVQRARARRDELSQRIAGLSLPARAREVYREGDRGSLLDTSG